MSKKNKKASKKPNTQRCATPRCKGEPAVKYLGQDFCQKCWTKVAADKDAPAAAESAIPLGELGGTELGKANEATWAEALNLPRTYRLEGTDRVESITDKMAK